MGGGPLRVCHRSDPVLGDARTGADDSGLGETVWLRLGAASHVDVLVNGKPASRAPLLGTLDLVLGPRGIASPGDGET